MTGFTCAYSPGFPLPAGLDVSYLSRLKWTRVSQRGQLDAGTGVATDEAGAGEVVDGGWLEVCLAVDVGVWPGDG